MRLIAIEIPYQDLRVGLGDTSDFRCCNYLVAFNDKDGQMIEVEAGGAINALRPHLKGDNGPAIKCLSHRLKIRDPALDNFLVSVTDQCNSLFLGLRSCDLIRVT